MKTFFSIIITLGLIIVLPIVLFGWTIKTTLLTASFYHDVLQKSDGYTLVMAVVKESVTDQIKKNSPDFNADSVLPTLQANITPTWFYQTIDTNLATIFNWLKTSAGVDQLQLSIDTAPLKQTIQQVAGQQVDGDVLSQMNIPDRLSLQHDAIAQMDPSQQQVLNDQLKLVQQSYQQLQWWLTIMTGLAVGLLLILFLIHIPHWNKAVHWMTLPAVIISGFTLLAAGVTWLSASPVMQFVLSLVPTDNMTLATQALIKGILGIGIAQLALRSIEISGAVTGVALLLFIIGFFLPHHNK